MALPIALAGGKIASTIGLGLLSGVASGAAHHVTDGKLSERDANKEGEAKTPSPNEGVPSRAEF